jgi:3-hydroxy-9,10-secoandrosta-1,3,5(10)-triene-9,17-dione monooxygenase reductase component
MHQTDPSRISIGKVLGRIPSGIFILTARHEAKAAAMLASWVQQVAFEPPAVSISIAKGRPIRDLVRASHSLVLSIIPKDDTTLMKRYARGVRDDEDPFEGIRTLDTPSGAPALADGLGFLECRVIQICDFGGDHELFIARVAGGTLLRDGHAFSHQRGNGFHY